jgi:hypothetical protein
MHGLVFKLLVLFGLLLAYLKTRNNKIFSKMEVTIDVLLAKVKILVWWCG